MEQALRDAPARQTCAASTVVAEQWNEYAATAPDACARWAWAATRCVAEAGPIEAKRRLPRETELRGAVTAVMMKAGDRDTTTVGGGADVDCAVTGMRGLLEVLECVGSEAGVVHGTMSTRQRQWPRDSMRMPCSAALLASRWLGGRQSAGAGRGGRADRTDHPFNDSRPDARAKHIPWWRRVEATLLPKEPSPDEFKKLRPITVLESSSKLLGRLLLEVAEELDVGTHAAGVPDSCM